MSLGKIFQISSQAMTAQRERLEASVANLANANTTRTASTTAYQRRNVVFQAVAIEKAEENRVFSSFQDDEINQQASLGVKTYTYTSEATNANRQYQPNHPDADKTGYVTFPDVDPLEESVNIISASRAFEANATAFNTAKELVRSVLKLGES